MNHRHTRTGGRSTGRKRFTLNAALLVALASLVFVGGVAAAGKIYKTVDKDGNVIFTDVPPRKDESSKTVELDSLNSYESDGTTTLRSPDGRELWIIEDETEEDTVPTPVTYDLLRINSPSDDETVRDNAGNLTVAASIRPELHVGHSLRLLLDGVPKQSSRVPNFRLTNVDRGTHQLTVEVIDETGAVLFTSPASVVHLMRHSVLGPT